MSITYGKTASATLMSLNNNNKYNKLNVVVVVRRRRRPLGQGNGISSDRGRRHDQLETVVVSCLMRNAFTVNRCGGATRPSSSSSWLLLERAQPPSNVRRYASFPRSISECTTIDVPKSGLYNKMVQSPAHFLILVKLKSR